jgi:hypothetical protein
LKHQSGFVNNRGAGEPLSTVRFSDGLVR